jgi:hypothetical protein
MNPACNPHLPLTSVDLLHRTIDLIEASLAGDPAERPPLPQLVAVTADDEGIELGLLPLDDPIARLQGFTAPPDWWAIGVIAAGTAKALDLPDDATWRVEVIHLVARTGEGAAAHRRQVPDDSGIPDTCRSDLDGSTWSGLLDDHLRRTLGLATLPAPASTLPFWTALWLDVLCARAACGELGGATWSDLAARHPARRLARLARQAGETGEQRSWGDIDLVEAGERLARSWTWAALRRASAGTVDDILGVLPADVAAWMDDGLFARLHLSEFPEILDLLDVLEGTLDPALMTRLRAACRAWSIQI